MTTNFNFTRFTNLLKLDIAENWKNSLFGLLGIYAAFLIPMLGWLWNPSAYSFHQFCNNMLGVVHSRCTPAAPVGHAGSPAHTC